MDQRPANPEVKIRRGISWSPTEERLANWIAERTDGGNVSGLLRRLLRSEVARYPDAPVFAAARAEEGEAA